jgi:hypothetical protein
MAQKVTSMLVDDLDGTQGDDITTVRFGLDGVEYEIDLTAAHADQLRDHIGDFVNAARRTGGRLLRGRRPAGLVERDPNEPNAAEVREWAKRQGKMISDRGRVPTALIDEYKQQLANTATAAKPAKATAGRKRR